MEQYSAAGDQLSLAQLYGIMRLRAAVFSGEQGIDPLLDFDDADLLESTKHFWIENDGLIVSNMRLAGVSPTRVKLGRVATLPEYRKQGLASQLIQAAISSSMASEFYMHAESQLAEWYSGFGFEVVGDEFEEVGLPHVAMILQS